jgi:oligo-1,6-glucosidase
LGKEGVLVILNFSKDVVLYDIPAPLRVKPDPIINSETSLQFANNQLTLLPYQAVVLELGP